MKNTHTAIELSNKNNLTYAKQMDDNRKGNGIIENRNLDKKIIGEHNNKDDIIRNDKYEVKDKPIIQEEFDDESRTDEILVDHEILRGSEQNGEQIPDEVIRGKEYGDYKIGSDDSIRTDYGEGIDDMPLVNKPRPDKTDDYLINGENIVDKETTSLEHDIRTNEGLIFPTGNNQIRTNDRETGWNI